MNKEYINLLNLREYSILYSSLTKEPFVTEKGECFLCVNEEKVKELVAAHRDTFAGEKRFLTTVDFCNGFYGIGISEIHVFNEKNEEITIPLTREDAEQGYYNPRAVFLASQLLLTKKKSYLRELIYKPLIVPIIIKERQERQYPVMNYVCAITKKGVRYSVAFTTLGAFEEWNKTQADKYSPLETTLLKYSSIIKKRPVIIDPETKALVLTSKQINGAKHK